MTIGALRSFLILGCLAACGVSAAEEMPTGEFDVRVLAGGTSCQIQKQPVPCADSGARLRDNLKVPTTQLLFVVVYNDEATLDQMYAVGVILKDAGYVNVKFTRLSFISQPGQSPGGS